MYCESFGKGPNIVLLHGWGMSSAVWASLAEQLQVDFTVTLVDLPGHGRSEDSTNTYSMNEVVDEVVATLPEQSIILGWSLGGLVAQVISLRFPEKVSKLILTASNAQFECDKQWPYAIKAEVLDGFIHSLTNDYRATLQRFLMLQALGDENAKQTLYFGSLGFEYWRLNNRSRSCRT